MVPAFSYPTASPPGAQSPPTFLRSSPRSPQTGTLQGLSGVFSGSSSRARRDGRHFRIGHPGSGIRYGADSPQTRSMYMVLSENPLTDSIWAFKKLDSKSSSDLETRIPFPPAAAGRLDHDRETDFLCGLKAFLHSVDRLFASRNHRNARRHHSFSCLGLISHLVNDLS